MSDGIRTRDRLDHNQELYQLSYAHREGENLSVRLPYGLAGQPASDFEGSTGYNQRRENRHRVSGGSNQRWVVDWSVLSLPEEQTR